MAERQKLGFLLIAAAVLLVVQTLGSVLGVVNSYVRIFASGQWGHLTDMARETYDPFLPALVLVDTIGNLAFAVLGVITIVLFVRRHHRLPLMYAGLQVFVLGLIVGSALIGSQVEAIADHTPRALVEAMILRGGTAVFWIIYFLRSAHVRSVFQEPSTIHGPDRTVTTTTDNGR